MTPSHDRGPESVGPGRLVADAGDARLTVDAAAGGRISSLVVAGQELLVTAADYPVGWGCYPMAPFAGRIRDGRFPFSGRSYQVPRNLPPHAIHGTVFTRPWTVTGPDTMAIDLGPDWPFAGRVRQCFRLRGDALRVELALDADEPMPASLGWHPWFRRVLAGTDGRATAPSGEVELEFEAGAMWVRDGAGIPTGEHIPPGPRPWDDCFTDITAGPRLVWPGALSLEVRSDAEQWVVYDAPDALCVEPQTAPPNFPTIAPVTVVPDAPLEAWMEFRWELAAATAD